MTYEKIAKHQAFVAEKGQALKESNFDFNRSTTRNKRLIQLNYMVMESLIELNAQTMNEAFAGGKIEDKDEDGIKGDNNEIHNLEKSIAKSEIERKKDKAHVSYLEGFIKGLLKTLEEPIYAYRISPPSS